MDEDGVPEGPWTPDLLADAITQITSNRSGIELRTVQLWFQENDRGISADNIRWLARIFGCGEPESISAWQAELASANARLAAKRKTKRENQKLVKVRSDTTDLLSEVNTRDQISDDLQPLKMRYVANLAQRAEGLFSSGSKLNLPAGVWAGCVTLGFLSYVMGVHNVNYSPKAGLEKQVGFFWAPNWTILEMTILPLFLMAVSSLLEDWKANRKKFTENKTSDQYGCVEWGQKVASFSASHWTVLFVCFVIVFAVQWIGVHLQSLLTGDHGNSMMDWTLIALVRPDVVSIPEAIVLSMLAFLYTAAICYLFLTGLVLIFTATQDFTEVCNVPGQSLDDMDRRNMFEAGSALVRDIFRCTILGIWIATCIKLQAAYLLSDGENIVSWLIGDALFALGISDGYSGWLGQRALAHFTSFLLLFSTCSVFFFGYAQIIRTLESGPRSNRDQPATSSTRIAWRTMLGVVGFLATNFLFIGQFAGFSLLLVMAMIVSIFCLFNPLLGHGRWHKSHMIGSE